MKPVSITISEWGPFKRPQTFHFPKSPGLYFMFGVNKAEPRLENNGAGKTSIWAALYWLLFGKTPRGLKASDVANWESQKDARVSFTFELADGSYSLLRNWSPNKWTLTKPSGATEDLTKDETNFVLATLRLEASSFLNCILMAQAQPMFLDQKADVKASLFSEVMGLDVWLNYSKEASKRASVKDMTIRQLERKLSELKGQLESINTEDLVVSRDAWERERANRLNAIEVQYNKLLDVEKQAKAYEAEAETNQKLIQVFHDNAKQVVFDETIVTTELANKTHAAYTDLAVAESEAKQAAADVREFKDGEACNHCGQNISASHWDKHMQALTITSNRAASEARRLFGIHRAAAEKHSATSARLRKKEMILKQAQGELEDAGLRLHNAKREVSLTNRDLDDLEDKAETINKETNPYASMMRKVGEEREKLQELFEVTQEQLDEATAEYSRLSYWVKGFKEIRLQHIDTGLSELEVEVNSAVTALGLVDWELLFEVDRETKSGSLQRGFNVRVKSPHNDRDVPWEAWSGGEHQRLNLAGNMGLADLIRSRSGTPLNLECWDESTNGMSPQGIIDLFDCLKSRALRENRIIFIIDHHAQSYGGFDGTVTITKTRHGSMIEHSYV